MPPLKQVHYVIPREEASNLPRQIIKIILQFVIDFHDVACSFGTLEAILAHCHLTGEDAHRAVNYPQVLDAVAVLRGNSSRCSGLIAALGFEELAPGLPQAVAGARAIRPVLLLKRERTNQSRNHVALPTVCISVFHLSSNFKME